MNVKWDQIAFADEQNEGEAVWTLVTGDDQESYKSWSTSEKNCWQQCTAGAILYEAYDGIAPNPIMEERNTSYLKALKEQREFTVLSGWRTWSNRFSSSISDGFDALPFVTKFAPWEPAEEPVLLDEGNDDRIGEETEE